MVLSKGIVNVPELVKYWKEAVTAATAATAAVSGRGNDSSGNSISNESSSKRQKISNS